MEDNKGILVFGETSGDNLSYMTRQLIQAAKNLSDALGENLHLAFLGGEYSPIIKKGYGYGVDRVYMAVDPMLENYITDPYLQAMEQIVKKLNPRIILFGQNDIGLDLAPRLAYRLKVGVTLDCVELKVDHGKEMEPVKPVFGGKAHCRLRCADKNLQIVAIREDVFDPADYNESIENEAIPINLNIDPSLVRMRFIRKEEDEGLYLALKLAAANIVVSGGRGLKEKKDIELIKETADIIGGAIACSRPIVDKDWLPSSLQIGLTGKKVHPTFYIAVGISGALQHMAGCIKSKIIVAINTDESAPIFKFSHLAVVGDYKEVLSGFINELKRNSNY